MSNSGNRSSPLVTPNLLLLPILSLLLLLLLVTTLPQPSEGHRVRVNQRRPASLQRRVPRLGFQTSGDDLVTQSQLDNAISDCKREVQFLLSENDDYADLIRLRNDYYLAFRATAGIGQSVYQAYVTGHHDDDRMRRSLMHCGCLSVRDRRPCESHYKSRIIPLWSLMKIDRVRVSIYSRGIEQVYFEFDGRDSTALNFFNPERLISSSFSDTNSLPSTYNYFSIPGHEEMPKVQRRFFVNRRYAGGCQKDEGWMAVLDTGDNCGFTRGAPVPVFLYSAASTSQLWSSGRVELGEVLVVAVKFRPGFNPNLFRTASQCLP